jgi:hypothetical protein
LEAEHLELWITARVDVPKNNRTFDGFAFQTSLSIVLAEVAVAPSESTAFA